MYTYMQNSDDNVFVSVFTNMFMFTNMFVFAATRVYERPSLRFVARGTCGRARTHSRTLSRTLLNRVFEFNRVFELHKWKMKKCNFI